MFSIDLYLIYFEIIAWEMIITKALLEPMNSNKENALKWNVSV
jgi:hypothetical protein